MTELQKKINDETFSKGITQIELAKRMGISYRTFMLLRNNIAVNTLWNRSWKKVADYYNVSVTTLRKWTTSEIKVK